MAQAIERQWWPVLVETFDRPTEEAKAKVEFLDEAMHQGFRGFIEQSDCGAIADDGRECRLIWRGKQRCEILLMDGGEITSRQMLTNPAEAAAFRRASAEALAYAIRDATAR